MYLLYSHIILYIVYHIIYIHYIFIFVMLIFVLRQGNITKKGTEKLSCPMHHYCDVIMGAIASEITSHDIVYSTVYSGADQRKHQSFASLAFERGTHRGPVTRKMFHLMTSSWLDLSMFSLRQHRRLSGVRATEILPKIQFQWQDRVGSGQLTTHLKWTGVH